MRVGQTIIEFKGKRQREKAPKVASKSGKKITMTAQPSTLDLNFGARRCHHNPSQRPVVKKQAGSPNDFTRFCACF